MAEYTAIERKLLLQIARESIVYGLQHQEPLPVDLKAYDPHLLQPRACFVTLEIEKQLRGCIGDLQAHQALIADVADNAFNAAYKDPRFRPVNGNEIPHIALEISVLSNPQPMRFDSEAALLSQLQPGVDGLILSDHGYRGTFLPTVWDQLPNPQEFLQHLKTKAGLAMDYWSPTLIVQRYTTELIQ